uniref:NYN domain-containing protein n=1 Tax=Octactis speculum TaxID=3111310 RepID=A0A7S2MJY4_9STRA
MAVLTTAELQLQLDRAKAPQTRVFIDASNILLNAPDFPGLCVESLIKCVEGIRDIATRFVGGSSCIRNSSEAHAAFAAFRSLGYSVTLMDRLPGQREQFVDEVSETLRD